MPIAKPSITSSSKFTKLRRLAGTLENEKVLLGDLCKKLDSYLPEHEIEKVCSAYEIGAKAHEGQRRLMGESYINHPLEVALLLADLHLDSNTIIAAILHDTIEDTALSKQDLANRFGEEIAALVEGVSKVSYVEFETPLHAEAENLRRMVLAMSGDIRVILIKLADRMNNLESLHVHRLEKRKRIAAQTSEIYVPIAHLLGMYSWQKKLEDLCFKAIYPKRFETISKAIERDSRRADKIVKKHIGALEKILKDARIKGEVSGRLKNVSALHKKMRQKGNSLKAVQDVFAFRIVVNSVDDCYRTLGLVHNRYKPISGEFDDYIAIPKINGYQSLHTTVYGTFGRTVEVQIRTVDMHRIAESGVASHLQYKTYGAVDRNSGIPGIQWINDLVHTSEEDELPGEYLENLKLSLFPDDVYVFTPQGEIKRLKKGATVIDFAYAVHSDVGNRAKSASINGQRVALHTQLTNGDHVEIEHDRFARPDASWLNFAVTSKARMAIRNALKLRDRDQAEIMGDKLLKKALKERKIKPSAIGDKDKELLAKKLKVESWSTVLYELGMGQRIASVIVRQLFPEAFNDPATNASGEYSVAIHGTEGLGIQYAKCCSPIPGDPIVGFSSINRGIVIHTEDCINARDLKHGPERWNKFHWTSAPQGHFNVTIRLDADNKKGVLAGIAARIAGQEANISGGEFGARGKDIVTMEFDIEVTGRNQLASIIKRIKNDPAVHRVRRVKSR